MATFAKDKQFYDVLLLKFNFNSQTLESSQSTRFTDTCLSHKQDFLSPKQKLIQSPENKEKQQTNEEEEFTQNFKEHYDIALEALTEGKKVSRDCKLEENDLEYALNVLGIKTKKELNEIEFSLRPTIEKAQYRMQMQQTNFEIQNSEDKRACKMISIDFQEIQQGYEECVQRIKELEKKTGNWHAFKQRRAQREQEEGDKTNSANVKKPSLTHNIN